MWWLTVLPLASAYGERYYVVAAPASPALATNLGTPLAGLYSGAAPAVHALPTGSPSDNTTPWMPTFVVMLAIAGGLALRENSFKVHRAPQPAGYALSQLRPALTRPSSRRSGVLVMKPKNPKAKKDIQVVLSSPVEGLGKAGELVMVKPAFLENVIVRQGLGARATPEIVAEFQAKAAAVEAALAAAKGEAQEKEAALARAFGEAGCVIEKKVGPQGEIFGSVTSAELAELFQSKAGVAVDKKTISVPDIKKEEGLELPAQKVGQSAITVAGSAVADIKLHPEVACKVKVLVVAAA